LKNKHGLFILHHHHQSVLHHHQSVLHLHCPTIPFTIHFAQSSSEAAFSVIGRRKLQHDFNKLSMMLFCGYRNMILML
jgi:hypothetical protein